MPLTPEDVSNKRFTAVRLREGYDMGEVDQFLDEVEAELTRLYAENDELRSKLEASQRGESVEVPPRPEAQPKPEPEPEPEPETKKPEPKKPEPETKKPEPAEKPEPAADENVVAEFETIRVTTTSEASRAATRLLEMAGSNADELVSEAQQEADKILADARSEAERAEQEARERAEALESETAERRKQLMGDLESEKSKLEGEVGELREFEKTYRQELRDYFQKQLSSLQGDSGRGADNGSAAPTQQESSSS